MTTTDPTPPVHEVYKYEHEAPLAEGRCTCGRAVRYNLTVQ